MWRRITNRCGGTGALSGLISQLGAMLFLSGAGTARACPDCVIGRVARELVWTDNFAFNLAAAITPFAMVAATCIWADRIGGPSSQRGSRG
jgi:hypothetical protein